MRDDERRYMKEQLNYALAAANDLRFPKKWREGQLRIARNIERQLEGDTSG